MEPIPVSRCSRCGRVCAPPARFCPDDATLMEAATLPGDGHVLSFTTLHSPPAGFAAPLHMALVELEGGAKFFCHGTETRGVRIGTRVGIEAVGQVYYFSTLSLGERARLFWSRGGERGSARLAAFARSAAKRFARRPRSRP